jgi:hypothetical protein
MTQTHSSQSNTRAGDLPVVSAADLSGKEGYLAKITSAGKASLPSADPVFLIVDGADASGDTVALRPLAGCGRTFRAILSGTCNAGDVIVPEAVATAPGKVRTLPAGTATYLGVGIALEAGVDGQLIQIAPMITKIVVT